MQECIRTQLQPARERRGKPVSELPVPQAGAGMQCRIAYSSPARRCLRSSDPAFLSGKSGIACQRLRQANPARAWFTCQISLAESPSDKVSPWLTRHHAGWRCPREAESGLGDPALCSAGNWQSGAETSVEEKRATGPQASGRPVSCSRLHGGK